MHIPPALEDHLAVLRGIAEDGWKKSLVEHLQPTRNTNNWQHMIDELRFFTAQLRKM